MSNVETLCLFEKYWNKKSMFHIFCKSLQPCAPPMENTLVQCNTDFGGGRKNGSKCCIIFREIAKSSFMGGKFEQNIYYIVEERVFHELSYFVNFLRNNQQFFFSYFKSEVWINLPAEASRRQFDKVCHS